MSQSTLHHTAAGVWQKYQNRRRLHDGEIRNDLQDLSLRDTLEGHTCPNREEAKKVLLRLLRRDIHNF